ncbi:hypothetical protein IFM47457_05787 [Aspergillus lentulus]|nr:hypothetical protein IFM47457_05787 [Aspergillus lentulus]
MSEDSVLVKWNGWNRKIHNILDGGKVAKGYQPFRGKFFFQEGQRGHRECQEVFPYTNKASELSSSVQKALHDDPEIASKSLGEQFDKLLLQPLLKLDQLGQEPQTTRANTLCLWIFLTSRPELLIRLSFSGIENDNYEQLALHEVSEKVTERDIYLFLKDQLIRIKHDRNIT